MGDWRGHGLNYTYDRWNTSYKVYHTDDTDSPILSNISPTSVSSITDTTPTITFTTYEMATCRLSLTDENYDDMNDDVSCEGTGTTSQACTAPDLGADGEKNLHIACADNYGNEDSSDSNTRLTYTLDTSAQDEDDQNEDATPAPVKRFTKDKRCHAAKPPLPSWSYFNPVDTPLVSNGWR